MLPFISTHIPQTKVGKNKVALATNSEFLQPNGGCHLRSQCFNKPTVGQTLLRTPILRTAFRIGFIRNWRKAVLQLESQTLF